MSNDKNDIFDKLIIRSEEPELSPLEKRKQQVEKFKKRVRKTVTAVAKERGITNLIFIENKDN